MKQGLFFKSLIAEIENTASADRKLTLGEIADLAENPGGRRSGRVHEGHQGLPRCSHVNHAAPHRRRDPAHHGAGSPAHTYRSRAEQRFC